MWVNLAEAYGEKGVDDDGNGFVDDLYGWNFLHDTNNPYDDNGHGSHVAGIIAAQRGNGVGVAGISDGARVMALKILDERGEGDVSQAIPAIRYANANGARVITNSWGGIPGAGGLILGLLLEEALSETADTLFVVASGNDGVDISASPYYPASFLRDWTLTVAAYDRNGLVPSWSNFGKDNVHLTAPGENITSTWTDNQFRLSSGTSMAAPMAVGTAALLLSDMPRLKPQQVLDILLASAVDDPGHQGKSITRGRLNAHVAKLIAPLYFFSPSKTKLTLAPTKNAYSYSSSASSTPSLLMQHHNEQMRNSQVSRDFDDKTRNQMAANSSLWLADEDRPKMTAMDLVFDAKYLVKGTYTGTLEFYYTRRIGNSIAAVTRNLPLVASVAAAAAGALDGALPPATMQLVKLQIPVTMHVA
eukprot:GHVT01095302.1.p1 GENE.GHVT01095302.1~~GHVT01095302.1.p1  ORF type:complete len:418 (-),score=85.51 GHVT01095302.1:811-2064(-)